MTRRSRCTSNCTIGFGPPYQRSLAVRTKGSFQPAAGFRANVSRIIVLSAFQQLHAEGYLEGTVGSGTYVAKSIPDHAVKLTLGDALRSLPSDPEQGPRRSISDISTLSSSWYPEKLRIVSLSRNRRTAEYSWPRRSRSLPQCCLPRAGERYQRRY
jgi:DNA-binding transcriptional MocR family regulator